MIVHAYVVRSVALSDPLWKALPTKREIVFPLGEPPSNDGRRWRFTEDDLASVVQRFTQRTEPAPVYWEHGSDVSKGKKAAGWIDKVELGSDGLYAYVRYTPEAKAEIETGSWGYRSPGFEGEEDEEGYTRPRALLEMSLVNEPAIGGMPPVQASATASEAAPASPDTTAMEGDTMSDATSGKVEAAKKKAAAFDKAGILNLAREAWGMGEAIDDSMLLEMLMKKLSMDDMEMESKTEPDATAPPALPEAADTQAADEDAGCGPKKPFGASRITLDESGDVKANIEKRDRIVEAVRTAARIGSITEPMLDDAAVFACHDVERFERIFCAPKAGRIINTTAADRKAQVPQTWAERETAVHRFAAQHRLSVAEARKQMEG